MIQEIKPGNPITPEMSREEKRARAHQWVEDQLGWSVVENQSFNEEPVSEEWLQQAELEELKERRGRLREHEKRAGEIRRVLPTSGFDELPVGIEERRLALFRESSVADTGIDQIREEISHRRSYRGMERMIWKGLKKADETSVDARSDWEAEKERARALDKAKCSFEQLGPEQQRGVRARLETSGRWEPGTEILEEALSERRPSPADLRAEEHLRQSLRASERREKLGDGHEEALGKARKRFEELPEREKERVRGRLSESEEEQLEKALSRPPRKDTRFGRGAISSGNSSEDTPNENPPVDDTPGENLNEGQSQVRKNLRRAQELEAAGSARQSRLKSAAKQWEGLSEQKQGELIGLLGPAEKDALREAIDQFGKGPTSEKRQSQETEDATPSAGGNKSRREKSSRDKSSRDGASGRDDAATEGGTPGQQDEGGEEKGDEGQESGYDRGGYDRGIGL